jgi:hypothetical protein
MRQYLTAFVFSVMAAAAFVAAPAFIASGQTVSGSTAAPAAKGNSSSAADQSATSGNAAKPAVKLPDPSPQQVQQIIQEFASKERLFRDLLKNSYTYSESIKLDEVDDEGGVTGEFAQQNDIIFTPEGQREIVCTYCPQSSLRQIGLTQDDVDDFFNMEMYTLSLDDLPKYNITYVDHEPLDQLHTYVFDVTPKTIEKGQRYFKGKIWVDDHDIQIVKSAGKAVPDIFDKKGNPVNLFPPFETYRQLVDGKYWFPVWTHADTTLFDDHIKLTVKFYNYKMFRVNSRILSVQTIPNRKTPAQALPPPAPPKP